MFFRLLKMLIKSTYALDRSNSKAKSRRIIVVIGVLIVFATLFFMLFPLSRMVFSMVDNQAATAILSVFLQISLVVSIIFSLRIAYGIFGPSRDLPFLLSLPIHRGTIFAARMSLGYLNELITTALLILPVFIAYISIHPSIATITATLIIFFILPALILSISTIITLLLLKFMKFLQIGESFFMVLSTIVTLGIALTIQFASQNLGASIAQETLPQIFQNILPTLTRFGNMFPPTYWAASGITKPFSSGLWLFITISAIIIALTYFLGGRLYKQGAQFIQSSKKKKTNTKITFNQHSIPWAIIKKDFWVIFRSPAFAMNTLSTLLIGPIMFFVMVFRTGVNRANIINEFSNESSFVLFYIIFGIILFFSSLNIIASTAVSREGRCLWINLIMPVSITKQLISKIALAQIVYAIESILLFTLMILFLKIKTNALYSWGAIVAGILGSIAPQIACALIDFFFPKVKWESEQAAMKNNFNVIISMLSSMLMLIPQLIICIIFRTSIVNTIVISILVSIVEIALLIFILSKSSNKILKAWQKAF